MGRAEYLERCAVPTVFIQSTHDQYGPRQELEAAAARWAGPKRIVWIEAADHFFAGGLEALEEQVAAVAAEW